MDPKAQQTIEQRQKKEKELFIEQFKKTPIVQVACEKVSVSRATYYRWRKDDTEFATQADFALAQGILLINDLAESQLITSIKDKNLNAIQFWLKHHHQSYTTKVELTNTKSTEMTLTPEQETLMKKALALSGVTAVGIENNES